MCLISKECFYICQPYQPSWALATEFQPLLLRLEELRGSPPPHHYTCTLRKVALISLEAEQFTSGDVQKPVKNTGSPPINGIGLAGRTEVESSAIAICNHESIQVCQTDQLREKLSVYWVTFRSKGSHTIASSELVAPLCK